MRLLLGVLCVGILGTAATVQGQITKVILPGQNNVPIRRVQLRVNGSTINQSAETPHWSIIGQTNGSIEVRQMVITDGSNRTLSVGNFEGATIANMNITSSTTGMGVFNNGSETTTANLTNFRNAVIASTQDNNLNHYVYSDYAGPLPPAGTADWDLRFTKALTNNDYVVVSERYGNSPFVLRPLDRNGNLYSNGNTLVLGGPDRYTWSNPYEGHDWNTGYASATRSPDQAYVFTVFDVSQFGLADNQPVHGFRIDNDGDADLKFFGASDDTFTNNPPYHRLGNVVFMDSNLDGNYDVGEGVGGVTVQLLNTSNSVLQTTTTATSTANRGLYLFEGMGSGTYRVRIPNTEFASGRPLFGMVSTAPTNPIDDAQDDNSATGNSGTFNTSPATNGIVSPNIVLTQYGEPTGEAGVFNTLDDTDDDNGNLTVDFALTNADWGDYSGFPATTQIANSVLRIGSNATDPDPANTFNSTATADDTLGTDDEDLTMPAFTVGTATNLVVPVTLSSPITTARINVWVDWNGDGDVLDTNEASTVQSVTSTSNRTFSLTPPTGTAAGTKYLRIRLVEGSTSPNFSGTSTLRGEVEDYAITVSVATPLTIGNLVWNDADNDGVKDAGESGIDGVTVQLFRTTNRTIGDADDVQVGSNVTTAGGGLYSFTSGITSGAYYYVKIPTPPAGLTMTGGIPDSFSTPSDYAENDQDNDNNGLHVTGIGTAVTSGVIYMQTGTESTSDGDSNNNTNLTIDFGFTAAQTCPTYMAWPDWRTLTRTAPTAGTGWISQPFVVNAAYTAQSFSNVLGQGVAVTVSYSNNMYDAEAPQIYVPRFDPTYDGTNYVQNPNDVQCNPMFHGSIRIASNSGDTSASVTTGVGTATGHVKFEITFDQDVFMDDFELASIGVLGAAREWAFVRAYTSAGAGVAPGSVTGKTVSCDAVVAGSGPEIVNNGAAGTYLGGRDEQNVANATYGNANFVWNSTPIRKIEIQFWRSNSTSTWSTAANGGQASAAIRKMCFRTAATDDYGDYSGFAVATQRTNSAIRIGSTATDGDTTAVRNASANGDDNTGADDEDLTMPSFTVGTATTLTVPVTITAGSLSGSTSRLNVFVDWNGDGDASDTGETQTVQSVTSTSNRTFSLTPPTGTTAGTKYLRIRFTEGSTAPAFSGTSTLKGEVEDYAITVGSGTVDPNCYNVIVANASSYNLMSFNGITGASNGVIASGVGFPSELSAAHDQNILVNILDYATLDRYNPYTGAKVSTFVGSGMGLDALTPGPDGHLYIAYGRVDRLNGATGASLGAFATVSEPVGIAFDGDGKVYVLDQTTASIRRYSSTGTFEATLVSAGSSNTHSLRLGPDRALYYCNADLPGVNRVTLAGSKTNFYTLPSGADPFSLVFGPNGDMWIGEAGTDKITVVNSSGALVRTITSGINNVCGMVVVPCAGSDFGDLSAAYPTLLAQNGARHIIGAGTLKMGVSVDPESDANFSQNGAGDDTDSDGDDEDGVTIPALTAGTNSTLTINSSGAGRVNAFFDWNNDGDFLDASEAIAELTVAAGNNNLTVAVPSGAITGTPIGARFRLSSAGGLTSVGGAVDGEVEDYMVTVSAGSGTNADYGDYSGFGVATQTANSAIRIGTAVTDVEGSSPANATATGDDSVGTDDEDLTLPSFTVGSTTVLSVPMNVTAASLSGSTARVNVFVDWNGDNDVSDANETQTVQTVSASGTFNFSLTPPTGTTAGTKYLRIRAAEGTTHPGFSGTSTLKGEVEDYAVTVNPAGTTLGITKTSNGGLGLTQGSTVTYTMTVTNSGATRHTNSLLADPAPAGTTHVAGSTAASVTGGWLYKRSVVIDQLQVDADLTNFPVRVALTSSNFTFANARADGFDIRFRDTSGNDLVFEREVHNTAGSTAVYWVRVPTVSGTVNTTFHLLYGNTAAADAANTTGGVWDSNYLAVWHMHNSPASTAPQMRDSTANGRHATVNGSISTATGQNGPAIAMTTNGFLTIPNSGNINITGNQFTLEGWVYPTNYSGADTGIISMADEPNANAERYHLGWNGAGTMNVRRWSGGHGRLDGSPAVMSNNSWQYLVGRYTGSAVQAYRNNVSNGSIAASGNITSTSARLLLGKRYDSRYFNGTMDEVRISNIARSDAWMKASYQSGLGGLLSVGAQVSNNGTTGNAPNLATGWTVEPGATLTVTSRYTLASNYSNSTLTNVASITSTQQTTPATASVTNSVFLPDYGDYSGFPVATQTANSAIRIGTLATDTEATSPANATATGDDNTGDDEDLTMPSFTVGTTTNLTVPVTITPASLSGSTSRINVFVDWNGDGDASDTGETQTVQSVTSTSNRTFSLTPPTGTIAGTKYLRIRFTEGSTAPTFSGASTLKGEVEDYAITVTSPPKDWLVTNYATSKIECFDSSGTWRGTFSTAVPNPMGITRGNDGYIYVTSWSASNTLQPRIYKLDGTSGALVSTILLPVAGTGNYTWDITTDFATGDIYVVSSEAGNYRYVPSTNTATLLSSNNGVGVAVGSSYWYRSNQNHIYRMPLGSGTSTQFISNVSTGTWVNGVRDVYVDPLDNIYASDAATGIIKKYNSAGTFVGNFASVAVSGGSNPTGINFGSDGNFYIIAHNENRIYRTGPAGGTTTLWSSDSHLSEPKFMVEVPVKNLTDYGDYSGFPMASQAAAPYFKLGSASDSESANPANTTATGDDISGIDDEELTMPGFVVGSATTLVVRADIDAAHFPEGRLNVFVDWNGDGDVSDTGETQTAQAVTLSANYSFSLTPPVGTTAGTKYLRIRLIRGTTAPAFSGSSALEGEVEDYAINVASCLIVTTTADTGPGSLREAIICANNNPGAETITFNIPAGMLTGGVAIISPATTLPMVTDQLTIDGTSQTAFGGNTNAVVLGAGGTVGVDGLALSQVNGPEIEIRGKGDGVTMREGLMFNATNCTVRGIAIHGFGWTNDQQRGDITFAATGGLVDQCVVGTSATSFTLPPVGQRSMDNGITLFFQGTVQNTLVGFTDDHGIMLIGASNSTVTNCEIRACGRINVGRPNISIRTFDGTSTISNVTISRNLITAHPNWAGADTYSDGPSNNVTFVNNTISNNFIGLSIGNVKATSSVSLFTLDRNIITGNTPTGAIWGISNNVTNNAPQRIRLTRNSIYNNKGPSLDYLFDWTTAGVTPNNGTKNANLFNSDMDYPVFTNVALSGSNLTVSGYIGNAAAGSATFAGATVEVFAADNVPSDQNGAVHSGDGLSVSHGEGRLYLGTLTANGSGLFSGTITLTAGQISAWTAFLGSAPTSTSLITGTATDANGNTSEFGAIMPVLQDFGDYSGFAQATSVANATIKMGVNAADAELTLTGNTSANADDTTGTDDEDGVTQTTLRAGQSGTITVNVTNTSGATAYLNVWADWNKNNLADTGEQIATNTAIATGTSNSNIALSVTPPSTTTNGTLPLRARITNVQNPGFSNTFPGTSLGEVEDHLITITAPNLDFGDYSGFAQATSVANTTIKLGVNAADAEVSLTGNTSANVDDTTGTDDEDGVTQTTLRAGQSGTITVNVTNTSGAAAYLNVWADWNKNNLADAGEQIATNTAIATGTSNSNIALSVTPPSATTNGTLPLRARITNVQNPGFSNTFPGTAAGEVEDHLITITAPNLDFGDFSGFAQATSVANTTLRIGTNATDAEASLTGNTSANVDDTTGTDDEDGVTQTTLRAGQSGTVTVRVTNTSGAVGYLNVWADWNQNNLADAGEQIATNTAIATGTSNSNIALSVTPPAANGNGNHPAACADHERREPWVQQHVPRNEPGRSGRSPPNDHGPEPRLR
jgi:uncharacterized repeat protein (TIGR01451 family)